MVMVEVEVSHCNYSEDGEEVVVAETDCEDEEEAEAEIEVVGCRVAEAEDEVIDEETVDDCCRAPGE